MSARRRPKRAPITRQSEDGDTVPVAAVRGTFAVPLVVSLALLLVSIAPHVARDPMYFFSITLIAGTAAVVLFGLSALYAGITGVPYFIDSEIPAAVFLGLHLLVTDPSTSPRKPLGKAIFGALYGLGVFVLYALLGAIGAPTSASEGTEAVNRRAAPAQDRRARRGGPERKRPRARRRRAAPP
jgi:hypothetical protein